MEKTFKTIEEQIKILKSRGLTINNNQDAYKILHDNNYYYLINGYKKIFIRKENTEEKFIDKSNINEIYSLYEFDRQIRIIILEYILLMERKIDTYVAYEFSKQYGHKNYLIQKNFNYNQKNSNKIEKFINDINLEIDHQYKNSNKMIKHYIDIYGHVPLWVLIRILSLGKVSKFYSFMKEKNQNNISRNFNLKSNILRIFLTNLAEARNICAHDEKIYDVKFRFKIPPSKYHSKLNLKNYKGNYLQGVNDLFSIILILKILLEEKQFKKFYKMIIKSIKNLKSRIKSNCFIEVLNKMGFPKNYKKLLKL